MLKSKQKNTFSKSARSLSSAFLTTTTARCLFWIAILLPAKWWDVDKHVRWNENRTWKKRTEQINNQRSSVFEWEHFMHTDETKINKNKTRTSGDGVVQRGLEFRGD